MSPNEARTRKEMIDPALSKAGWNLNDPNQVGIEIPVDGYDAEPWNGITDYCLYQPNGEVIAVVEAKKQVRDPNVAREQARHYITEIAKNQSFQPFAFLTNGLETYFWDQQNAAPRLVAGFFYPARSRTPSLSASECHPPECTHSSIHKSPVAFTNTRQYDGFAKPLPRASVAP